MAADDVRQVVMDVLSDPMNIPSTFWDYATQSWLKDAPVFPISQVFGFTQFTPSVAVVAVSETRTSSTYGDLATVGPQLTALPDGHYLGLWGCLSFGSPGVSTAKMGLQVNSGTPPSGDHAMFTGSSATGVINAIGDTFALSNGGSNTVTAKYASSDNVSSCSFDRRWVILIKYGNL